MEEYFYMKKTLLKYIAGAAAVLSLFMLGGCKKDEAPKAKAGEIVINEVVSSNSFAHTAADGSSPDYVEIKNISDHAINLEGCGLTDNIKKPYKFRFPEKVIGAGECMLIYCTGTEDTTAADGIFRTAYKLSSSGEAVYFSTPGSADSEMANVPYLDTDMSWGRTDDGSYEYFKKATPGSNNEGEHNSDGVFETALASLIINEYMMENDYSAVDSFGERESWAEIRNIGNETASLLGYGLSDDMGNAGKWVFPDVSVGAGETIMVWLSGKDTVTETGEIHANFSLSADDNALVLSQEQGIAIDTVTLPEFNDGKYSVGRAANDTKLWLYFPIPTPGSANSTPGFASLENAQGYLPDVYISEVKSTTEEGTDWIELHNKSKNNIDLSGYALSDSANDLSKYKLDGKSIGAGQYMVIELDEEIGFSLSAATENILLTDQNGSVIDVMSSGKQSIAVSTGRLGSAERLFFGTATKGAANSEDVYRGYAKAPVFSQLGGYTDAGTSIALSAGANETIYYTTDGSKPDHTSTRYTGPITVNDFSCIRAVSYADGKLPSEVVTENYIVGVTHEIPIVCVDMDPEDFDGNSRGIYAKGDGYYQDDGDGVDYTHSKANYWQDWEREMNFSFYEADGTKGVSFDAGIRIFGQYSRELAQKSFSVHLRGDYGQKYVTYPFFRDSEVTTFKSFLLRSSGQDWGKTKILDALCAQVIKDCTNVDMMEYRPCVLYVNGEYWGIYNIREKENENYIESYYGDDGAKKGNIDIIKGDRILQAGSRDDWMELRKYVDQRLPKYGRANQINREDVMEKIESQVDIDSLIDWICIEAYFGNTDTGNIRQYRYNGGKWRWMLMDMDWALQAGSEYSNYLGELITNDGHGSGNMFWTHLHMMLYYNDTWRAKFINRYAYLLNNVFDTERVCSLIDAMAAEIRPEMERNCERWGKPESLEKWESNIENMKKSAEIRRSQAVKELKKVFGLSDSKIEDLFPNG